MYTASNDHSLTQLVADLDCEEMMVRFEAIRGLAHLATEDSSALEVLVGALSSKRLLVPDLAATQLCRLGRRVNAFLPAIADALNTNSVAQFQAAWKVFVKLAPRDALVAPLVTGLHCEEFRISALAARYLGRLASDREEVAVYLANALSDGNAEVRWEAAKALGDLQSSTREVVSSLSRALQDQDPRVRTAAARTLGRLGSKGSASTVALVEALYDGCPIVRAASAFALGHMRETAAQSVPALVGALADATPGVRGAAAWALGRLEQEACSARGALGQLLAAEENPWVRSVVAETVRRLDLIRDLVENHFRELQG